MLDSKIDPETDSYTRISTIYDCLIGKRSDIWQHEGYNDPFKRVWISGPIIFSILYILMVRNYEKYMAKVLIHHITHTRSLSALLTHSFHLAKSISNQALCPRVQHISVYLEHSLCGCDVV